MTYTVSDLGRDGWSVYNAATRSEVRLAQDLGMTVASAQRWEQFAVVKA